MGGGKGRDLGVVLLISRSIDQRCAFLSAAAASGQKV